MASLAKPARSDLERLTLLRAPPVGGPRSQQGETFRGLPDDATSSKWKPPGAPAWQGLRLEFVVAASQGGDGTPREKHSFG